MTDLEADILIVGGGMAGVSLAYELSSHRKIVLIEREDMPGCHATGRSAAMFLPRYGPEPVRAISRASQPFFDRPPPGITDVPLLIPRPAMTIAREDQVAALRECHDPQAEAWIGEEEALALVPLLRPGQAVAALLDSAAADIEVATLLQGYWKCARANGVSGLFGVSIEAIRRDPAGWLVETPTQRVRAPLLINAAGAWADEVATHCGIPPIGLEPKRRTAVLIQPPEGQDIRDWPLVMTADESLYFKPDAGLLLVSPADETPSPACDAQPEELDIAIAIDRLQQVADIDVRRIDHRWAGLRTFVRDRCPVVGGDPEDTGFFWFAGQGGYGIQMAPALARIGAALVMGEELPQEARQEGVDVSALRPDRLRVAV
ncbi:MAG: FAD-binding oxidoreductase [Sphingomonadales bacterium]|nr:MAG: FAD-binding oxidoreductase [Sphingomonadales bacterium]TNF06078.1 MAG: FAD-binding oxidoreductase [Sphingomonadales bacterium]